MNGQRGRKARWEGGAEPPEAPLEPQVGGSKCPWGDLEWAVWLQHPGPRVAQDS